MEEQQIQDFIHRVMGDQIFRRELALDPGQVIGRECYSQRVADILLRLVPPLIFGQLLHTDEKWWHV